MIKLDKEAEKLGLQTTFKLGELASMAHDMQAKYDQLRNNRNKKRF